MRWQPGHDLDCVVICGGAGTRLMPWTRAQQKSMVRVSERPLLHYIVEYWRRYCSRFVFVTHHVAEQIDGFRRTLDADTAIVMEEEPLGIARALRRASAYVGDSFVTVLGDCLCDGDFRIPPAMTHGIGVTAVDDVGAIQRSYSVEVEGERVTQVNEKPARVVNDLCGMGMYFFEATVFDHIDSTPPSPRTGRVEITDVIQRMIDNGLHVAPVWFTGTYVNVTYPEDLHVARRIALSLARRSPERKRRRGTGSR